MTKDAPFPVRKMISISDEMNKEIEDYRFLNRIRSEAEAFRRILELGLQEARAQSSTSSGKKAKR